MPSSVFRCISVFQVYFGVYTDRNNSWFLSGDFVKMLSIEFEVLGFDH